MSDYRLPSTDDRPVAVLGGGVLGRRVACAWAAGGFNVIIYDPSEEQRIAAVHYCSASMSLFSNDVQSGHVQALDNMKAAVREAWLVIEAVPEHLDLKIKTFEELATITPSDAILCSNSSSYKSREMVQTLDLPARRRVLNMHYYMPPDNRIVELMTDGDTEASIFPFLVEKLKQINMHPFVAKKESTGLIFNRLWAAIKREILSILAEGVAEPTEIDQLWLEMWQNNPIGPVAMMDQVGLDTVSFIEEHYIQERHLSDEPVKFLKGYIDAGKLGAKSGKGGLLPPGTLSKDPTSTSDVPLLYFLDIGFATKDLDNIMEGGRVLVGASDGRPLKVLLSSQHAPDGVDISIAAGKFFWTCMGVPSKNDGTVFSANLDGTDVKNIVAAGKVHTPKQLTVDSVQSKLYFGDREGLRIWRCNFDGSDLELLVQAGDQKNEAEQLDQTRWCVGVAVSHTTGKFYWSQKGPSKGSQGRIFCANIEFPEGQSGPQRSDIECLFQNLPEPIDLEIDETHQILYWTDRGELPLGNSINRASLKGLQPVTGPDVKSIPGQDYELVVRNLHEAIGLKLDLVHHHIYVTDLGGDVYRFNLDGSGKKRFYEDQGAFTGIALSHV